MSAPLPKPPRATDPAASPARAAQSLDAPSVRTIGAILLRGRMTAMQLREASGLPRRTVYSALSVLRELGFVQQRRSLQDSRQSYFWLVDAALPPASNMALDALDALAAAEPADEPATTVL